MVEPMETGTGSLVENLKQELDKEMPPDVVEKFVFLLGDILRRQFADCYLKEVMPSDVVTCLEMDNGRAKVVLLLAHVLGNLDFHGQMGLFNFKQWIEEMQCHEENDHFVGREGDVTTVLEAMCSTDNLGVWIHGFGGLGKTTLAKEVGARARMIRHIDFIKMDLKQTETMADMYRAFLSECDRVSGETDLTVLETLTVNALKEKQNETWLLLDNLEHIHNSCTEAVNDFLNRLVNFGISKVKIMVTSRDGLEAANIVRQFYQHRLCPLDDESSLQLLRIYSKPIKLSEPDYRRAMAHCGNIPLALVLVANTIRSSGQFNPYKDSNVDETFVMDDCINYAFQKISPHLQQMLIQLTVFDKAKFDVVAIAHVLKISIGDVYEHLVPVCYADMLQTSQPGFSYQFHEMILLFLKNKRNMLPESVWNSTEQRFCTWVFQVLKRCYDEYYQQSTECIKYINEHTQLVRSFFNTLSQDVMKNASMPECEHMFLAAAVIRSSDTEKFNLIESMKRLCIENLPCTFFWKIQEIAYCVDNGCRDDARRLIEAVESDSALPWLYERDKILIKTDLLLQRGRIARLQNETVRASEKFREALHKLGTTDQRDRRIAIKTANIYNSLGNVAFGERDYDTALQYHEKAIELTEPLVGTNPNHELSMFKFNVGTIALAKARQLREISPGNEDKVEVYMAKCLQQFDESIEEHIKLRLNQNEAFADKLQVRSKARLEAKQFEGALSDALECRNLRNHLFEGNNTKKLFSNYHVGLVYLKKREYAGVGTPESRDLLQKSINCFNEVSGYIQDGLLTKDCQEMASFLEDFKRLARATGIQSYIQQVNKLAIRVSAGENPCSSSDSPSSSSDAETDTSDNIDVKDRKDSGVLDDLSDDDMSTRSLDGLDQSNKLSHPLDDAFGEDLVVNNEKRKRDSDSD